MEVSVTRAGATARKKKGLIIELADLFTEIREIKHPFKQGISAQKGIEF